MGHCHNKNTHEVEDKCTEIMQIEAQREKKFEKMYKASIHYGTLSNGQTGGSGVQERNEKEIKV